MLGSANLTGTGLGSSATPNRELGVELTQDQVANARTIILAWSAHSVDKTDLDLLTTEAKNLTPTDGMSDDRLNTATPLQLAETLLNDARDPDRAFWVKVENGDPTLEGWRQRSLFASPKRVDPRSNLGTSYLYVLKQPATAMP